MNITKVWLIREMDADWDETEYASLKEAKDAAAERLDEYPDSEPIEVFEKVFVASQSRTVEWSATELPPGSK